MHPGGHVIPLQLPMLHATLHPHAVAQFTPPEHAWLAMHCTSTKPVPAVISPAHAWPTLHVA
jgi:hypothetical protein